MNATSLYVSTCRLILQAKVEDTSSWLDLYKLFPCLRQSLSCTVCGRLLIEPYTPTETNCQHHVCRSCKGGRKKLKPSCSWCKDYSKYVENVQLRTLLQCYKKLCQYVTSSQIHRALADHTGNVENGQSLIEIIDEGTGFKDDFKCSNDIFSLPFSANNYTSTSTQTVDPQTEPEASASKLNGTSSSLYSVYAASGNRLTFKRTATDTDESTNGDRTDSGLGKRPNKIRKRMIGTTVTTCQCGQHVTTVRSTCRGYRCPCYSVDRPCIDCSCKGCNNPIGVNSSRDHGSGGKTTDLNDGKGSLAGSMDGMTSRL